MPDPTPPSLAFALPGDLARRTGGTIYDSRLLEGLGRQGWQTTVLGLPESLPFPDDADRASCDAAFATLPPGLPLMVDGLALGALPKAAARLAGERPLVALVHHPLALETGLDEAQRAMLLASEREALAAALHVVVTSAPTAATLEQDYAVPAAKITVAPPGTAPRPPSRGSGDGPFTILNVGSITPRKDQATLVRALARLPEAGWRAHIVGSRTMAPACADKLEALVASLGLADRVILHGELDTPALDALAGKADLFVSSALYEGFGMALAEALAAGLPVVAARGGAVETTVPAAAARFFAAGDDAGLARILRGLMDDAAARDELRRGAMAARAGLAGLDAPARIVDVALRRLFGHPCGADGKDTDR